MALLVSFAKRIVAFCYILLALGITFTSHFENGFFMNWFDNQAGEGYEYFIFWIGIAIALTITGGGKYSSDMSMKVNL